jgi:hypothetical protein
MVSIVRVKLYLWHLKVSTNMKGSFCGSTVSSDKRVNILQKVPGLNRH